MIVKRGEALRNPMWELRGGGGRKFTGGTYFYFLFLCLEDVQKR